MGKEGWNVPKPDVIPAPTFWPAGTALAVTFLFWGIATSPIFVVVGGFVLVVALAGWIGEIRNETR